MRSPLRYAEGPALLPPSTCPTRTLSSNWVTCMRKSSELLHVNYMEMEAACDVEAMVDGEGGRTGAIVWQNAMQSNSYFVKRQLLQ